MFSSCEKTCNCTATTTQTYTDNDPDFPDMPGSSSGTSNFTQKTKGKCSDLNSVTEQSLMGMVEQKTVTECK